MSSFEPQNIAAYLPYRAQENPDLLAVAVPHKTDANGQSSYNELSYAELNTLSDIYAQGLHAYGIHKGMRCALMVKPSIDFFALTFALFKIGAVLVCIDPGMGIKNIKKCLEESDPAAFIGIPKALIAKRLFSWPTCSINIAVCTTPARRWFGIDSLQHIKALGEKADPLEDPIQSKEELAAILFTSGSTGVPKGVVYKHTQFLAQVKALLHIYNISVGEVDLCTFPLFALFAPAIGMSSIIPDMDFTKPGSVNPLHVIQPIKHYNVTNMFGSPALLKQVATYRQKHTCTLPSLKRVISAGAPAQAKTLDMFSKMLAENTEIFTPYGATESLPVSSIGSKEILHQHRHASERGCGVCVGTVSDGIEIAIIPISDEPIQRWQSSLALKENTWGEIVVKGPVVTERYYHRAQSTQLAKITDGTQLRHRMGDIGYLDEHGKLWFCGRKSHRVVTAEKCYFTIPCEGILNTHPAVERTALIPVQCAEGIKPGICIELSSEANGPVNKQQIAEELHTSAEKYAVSQGIHLFYFHPRFPVDIRHNAKIGREQLAQWAQKQKPIIPKRVQS